MLGPDAHRQSCPRQIEPREALILIAAIEREE
jgi:hypothetical protein